MNASNDDAPNPDTSRRDFLRKQVSTAAVLAGGCVIGPTHAHAANHQEQDAASSDRPLRIGLIGAGGRGTGSVNDSLTINDNIQLVAAADLDIKHCKRSRNMLAERHPEKVAAPDTKLYAGLDAYKRILDDPEIDIVYLATPPGFRPRHIAEAVAAGKHLFAEKPSCVDPAGYRICVEAHDAAVKQGTAIVTGTQYRRQVNYIAAVKKIHEGAIGKIVSANSRYCTNGIWYRNRDEGSTDLEYQLKNWMHFIWLSGDQIVEQAVHNLDVMNWVMDSVPVSAFASGGRFTRPKDSEMWDAMSVDFEYPGNRMVSFSCRQLPHTKPDNGNVIFGTEGTMYIGAMSKGSRIVDHDGNETWSAEGKLSAAYKQEHKDLVDSIRAGNPIVELKQTAQSSLTAVMGRLAAYTGQLVDWDFVSKESTLDLFPENLTATSKAPDHGYAVPGVTKLV